MGGHGGLYLAIRHKTLFGAAGATSGGVDIRPFPNNWDIKKNDWEIPAAVNRPTGKEYVINLAAELHNGELN